MGHPGAGGDAPQTHGRRSDLVDLGDGRGQQLGPEVAVVVAA
jgi:hypothetical protein